jgi:hypothetical protein
MTTQILVFIFILFPVLFLYFYKSDSRNKKHYPLQRGIKNYPITTNANIMKRKKERPTLSQMRKYVKAKKHIPIIFYSYGYTSNQWKN